MRTAAVLPVKSFARAKQRLGASVEDALRLALAQAMVADVLLALSRTRAIERTIVVTREQSVALAAEDLGAIVVQDVAESGQPAAAALGVRRALADGFERVLCVPGDCPALDPAELDALLCSDRSSSRQARDRRSVVIVPDRHGTGTNGLLLSPPDAIAPSFGPDSCARHRSLALQAGIQARVVEPPSLLLDIDTGADLDELRARLAGREGAATRTRAVLAAGEGTKELPLTTTA
jgi:2-phospho-L-lactate/phosphoenolpyruvate guanylyltransferase